MIKAKERGLSLVEVMIILTVVGLILGASLNPLSALWRTDTYAIEKKKMESFHDAMLGYALRHQTIERPLLFVAGTATTNITLPAGRPYLPCSDVDGDGYEDRAGFSRAGLVYYNHFNPAVPGAPPGSTRDERLVVSNVEAEGSPNRLKDNYGGVCLLPRAGLPWKTLGVSPHDLWGNRYTYEVDEAFSGAVVGFNQDSALDAFDIRSIVSSAGDYQYVKRNDSQGSNVASLRGLASAFRANIFAATYLSTDNPIVVCNGQTPNCPGPTAPPTLHLKAGKALAAAFLDAPRKTFAQGDIIEGVPYVIVSHGVNGHGAIPHAVNMTNSWRAPSSTGATAQPRNIPPPVQCRWPLTATTVNITIPLTISSVQAYEGTNFPYLAGNRVNTPASLNQCRDIEVATIDTRSTTPTTLTYTPSTGYFFSVPQSSGNIVFDDIVIWQTRENLVGQLTKHGVFPAPPFPLLQASP